MATKEPFRVIVADPPWAFGDRLPGKKRGASKHYNVLSIDKIESFLADRPEIKVADDALLFMWRVSAMVPEAYQVVDAWGFKAKSEIVWVKTSRSGVGFHFGMGRYTRMAHESCIIASRGKNIVRDHSVRSVFDAAVREHSQKPDAFQRIVERLAPGPYLELFARRERRGWTCMGDELGRRAE